MRLAMIVIVPFRRSPDAAKEWLLLIFFEPAAGLILYLWRQRPPPVKVIENLARMLSPLL